MRGSEERACQRDLIVEQLRQSIIESAAAVDGCI